jgi:hypothetical protein
MKLRAPPHCSVVVHGGATLVVAPDGAIEVPEADAAHLLAHGIRPWASPQVPLAHRSDDRAIKAMSRAAVIAALTTMGRAVAPTTRTAELRRTLRRALAQT